MSKLDRILYVVAPVIGVIGFHGRKEYNSNHHDGSELVPLKTADELMNNFSNNKNEASSRYIDKEIRVSGTIKSIRQNQGTQTLLLSTSSALCSIVCHFDGKKKQQLNHLRPWQHVVIKGLCVGIFKDVALVRCELEGR